VLTALLALGVCALWWQTRATEEERAGRGRAPASGAAATAAPAAARRAPDAVAASTDLRPPSRWRTKARGALDRYVATTPDVPTLSELQRDELLAALVRVRRASRASRHLRPDHPAQAEQGRVLVEADRLFRDTLGVGVGEFVRALGPPGQIEDLAAARQ
jgi:hypothetical protein